MCMSNLILCGIFCADSRGGIALHRRHLIYLLWWQALVTCLSVSTNGPVTKHAIWWDPCQDFWCPFIIHKTHTHRLHAYRFSLNLTSLPETGRVEEKWVLHTCMYAQWRPFSVEDKDRRWELWKTQCRKNKFSNLRCETNDEVKKWSVASMHLWSKRPDSFISDSALDKLIAFGDSLAILL